MYLEIISGPYGYGICLEDLVIAGSSGGGFMHTEHRLKVSEERLKEALKRAGYKLVEIDQDKKGE
jgi:hypothetical protein